MSGAVIGFVAAFGALGGVGINLALRQSYLSTGTDTSAYWVFLLFYVGAALLTWSRYGRRAVPVAGTAGTASGSRLARV
ncbi:hypothetical protein MSHO_19240 [Mycobacterium shottsii]|nr:hypothetical protein MSHO_19240 [Mycobacterium shottsii]